MNNILYVFKSNNANPYNNLALEEYFLKYLLDNSIMLYLWQNEPTVVIGRNQNIWRECNLSNLERDNIHITRRLSGGGAVYHDLGNLNFTFIADTKFYDVKKQLSVISEACHQFGINAVVSGRNDITVDNLKFSGNAFYKSKNKSYHHGTLLINSEIEKMKLYLNPSLAKMESKGVKSIKSRVTNLKHYNSNLDTQKMSDALVNAFQKIYSNRTIEIYEKDIIADNLQPLILKNQSWDWIYGQRIPFTIQAENKFSWGEIQIYLNVKSGIINNIEVYTDAMNYEVSNIIKKALLQKKYDKADIAVNIDITNLDKDLKKDITKMLTKLF